jgi:hypothetical protein
VEARLDARIDIANRLSEDRVREAVQKFQGYVEDRIKEQQAKTPPKK